MARRRIRESKSKGFTEQLRAFRERDRALNDALISAQQLRQETKEQAEREAMLIVREAQGEGERLLEEVRGEVRRVQAELDMLERSRRSYLAQMRTLISRHLSEIDASDRPVPGVTAE